MIIHYLINFIFVVECVNINKRVLEPLVFTKIDGLIVFHTPEMNFNSIKRTIEFFNMTAEERINNLNFGVGKYFSSNGDILLKYNKLDLKNHPNLIYSAYEDVLLNFNLTHQKMVGYKHFSDVDFLNKNKPQFLNKTGYFSTLNGREIMNIGTENIHDNQILFKYKNYKEIINNNINPIHVQNLVNSKKTEIIENCNCFLKTLK